LRVERKNGNEKAVFNFEKLDVWHKAINFADQVYALTRAFPDNERFGLTNQMRRAAVSISSNLAEGSSRSSKSDFARFIQIATGSVYEVISQATIAKRKGFLPEAAFDKLYSAAEEQSKMLSGLKKSLNSKPSTLNS
jgi:four helix bundle protein